VTTNRFVNGWAWLVVLLVVVIAAGGIVAWARCGRSQTVEITTIPAPALQGEVFIDGEVSVPGIYPWWEGDSLEDIIRAAGGTTDGADLERLQLHVPGLSDGETPQKININRAEAWLLDALPGIGPALAQAIVDYREQHGPFHNTNELLGVDGIGEVTYESIKHLVTVDD
jgi:competence protein ComEA